MDSLQDRNPPEYHLAALNGNIREMMNATLRRHGLKLVEWRVLQCLSDQGPLTICDLAGLAVIERTATSRLVDRMQERGLLAKTRMDEDRRFFEVTLTDAGAARLVACSGDVAAARAALFAGMAEPEIATLLELLQRMQANAIATIHAPRLRAG